MTQKAADSALPGLGTRWSTARQFAGYGAASTLSLYLVVKVIWVLTALLGDEPKDPATRTADWVTLNMVTVGIWNRQGTMDEEFFFWDNQTFYSKMGLA